MLKKRIDCENTTIGILIFIFSMISFPVLAVELQTAAQESLPKYFKLEDHSMGGVCIDIMAAIEKVDPEIQFKGYQTFLPFKRLQQYLEDGKLDVFFGFKKTSNRESQFIFLDRPLDQVSFLLYTPPGVRSYNRWLQPPESSTTQQ